MTPYRRKVLAFALAMEAELKNNDHKGGWENMRASELIRRANWEFWELMGELSDATKSRTTGGDFTDSEKARIRFMSSLDSKFPTCPLNSNCMSPRRGCFVHEDCEGNMELALRCLDLQILQVPHAASK